MSIQLNSSGTGINPRFKVIDNQGSVTMGMAGNGDVLVSYLGRKFILPFELAWVLATNDNAESFLNDFRTLGMASPRGAMRERAAEYLSDEKKRLRADFVRLTLDRGAVSSEAEAFLLAKALYP